MNMVLGYARVSTIEQTTDAQVDMLLDFGCEKIFEDRGAKPSISSSLRPQLVTLIDSLRPGDTIVVCSLDRLGRSLKDLVKLIERFRENKVNFVSLLERIDTTSPAGELTFHVFASIAQFERSLISERTKRGLAAARARGRLGGRKPKLCANDIKKLQILSKSPDINLSGLAKDFGISRTTMYKYIKSD